MKEGITDAEYRITNRFENIGRVNEKICKFPPKKKDEGFSWICRIFQSKSLWKILYLLINILSTAVFQREFGCVIT